MALSIHSSIPTPSEKSARTADYDEEIELKNARYTLDPDAGLSKEEKWERNRQIFLNLPKTPGTPAAGFGGYPAMTPRTTAFTQLNGGVPRTPGYGPTGGYAAPGTPGYGPGSAVGAGPASRLPFREQFEAVTYGEVKVPDPI